jgi:hypothetical protein
VHIDPTTLFLVWFGGGFVVFLAWAGLVGQALMGVRPQVVRPAAIGLLAVVGVLHPAAAVSAIDLARLTRTVGRPPTGEAAADSPARRARSDALALPSWAMGAVYAGAAASVVVAIAAFVEAGGVPS